MGWFNFWQSSPKVKIPVATKTVSISTEISHPAQDEVKEVSSDSSSSYSERFDKFMPFIYKWECSYPDDKSGQYSNDPDDPGGPTKFGVDLTSAKLDHPTWTINDIKALTYIQSLDIYWTDYWKRFNVEKYAYPLGEVYFNAKQNGGHPDTWITQCDNDAKKFVDLQEQYYKDLCLYWKNHGKNDPYKYLPGWLNRTTDLRKYLNLV